MVDPWSKLCSLNFPHAECRGTVREVRMHLPEASQNQLITRSLLIISHTGLRIHDKVNALTNEACFPPDIDIKLSMASKTNEMAGDAQCPQSTSIKHFYPFCETRHICENHNHRRYGIFTTRIRLGHRCM